MKHEADREPDLLVRREGCAGRITLNRPKALNAMTYDMAMAIEAALLAWKQDDAVLLVLIDAAGERAFCAGGDIADLYRTGKAGDFAFGQRFWADEYRLNGLIAGYPKPYVAIMDGIVMGGGVGISAHGLHRIVTERSVLAMPECGIGLVPDVGGSLLLARAPGHLGEYLGLTGTRISGADAILTGFADFFVASQHLPELKTRLCETGDANVIADFVGSAEIAGLLAWQHRIAPIFGSTLLPDLLGALEAEASEWSAQALAAIRRASPLSIACSFDLIREVRAANTMQAALDLEYRFSSRCMEFGDFLEGVRAAIIDKDRMPKWRHDSIAAVSAQERAFMLAPVVAA